MRKRGMTLVEVSLVVAIIAIVTPVFYNLIDYQYKSFAMVEKKATESRHERLIYSIMHNQVRYANKIELFENVPSQAIMEKKEYDGYRFFWLNSDGEIYISSQELNFQSNGKLDTKKPFKKRNFGKITISYGASDSHKIEFLEFKRKDDKTLGYVYKGEGKDVFEGAIKLENNTRLPEAPKPPKKILVIAYRPFYEELDWK